MEITEKNRLSGSSFIIENDTILKVFEKVKTTAHFEQIMEALN